MLQMSREKETTASNSFRNTKQAACIGEVQVRLQQRLGLGYSMEGSFTSPRGGERLLCGEKFYSSTWWSEITLYVGKFYF